MMLQFVLLLFAEVPPVVMAHDGNTRPHSGLMLGDPAVVHVHQAATNHSSARYGPAAPLRHRHALAMELPSWCGSSRSLSSASPPPASAAAAGSEEPGCPASSCASSALPDRWNAVKIAAAAHRVQGRVRGVVIHK